MVVVGAVARSVLRPRAVAAALVVPGRARPPVHGVVASGQVHHGRGARVHFADGQALEVRPVRGGQARPRGLLHGQFEVEQVHHVVGICCGGESDDGRYAIL